MLLFLCAYPYFLRDKYFSMTIGKTYFFYGVTAVYAVGCLIIRNYVEKKNDIRPRRKNAGNLCGGIFLLSAVFSCFLSISPVDSFSGGRGRFMGLGMFFFIALAYDFITRFGKINRAAAAVFGLSAAVMNIIALLQFAGFDPFYLYAPANEDVRINFMSLIGNKDVFYSYLALTIPFFMYLSCKAEKTAEKIFCCAVCFFGFTGVFACNSDGAFIGMAAAFIVLFFVLGKNKTGLSDFSLLVLLFFAAAFLTALIKPDMSKFNIPETLVMRKFILPGVSGLAMLAAAVVFAVILLLPERAGLIRALRIAVAVLLAAAVLFAVCVFVYYSVFDTESDIGSLSEFLRFGPLWGNKRGYIWSRLFGIYKEFPLSRKLIGSGEETVELIMNECFREEMLSVTGLTFDNAHNEFLQYLVTHGALGLIFYLLFAVFTVIRAAKHGGQLNKAAALAVICYMAQSAVNISQSITTPLFFVFTAIAAMESGDVIRVFAPASPTETDEDPPGGIPQSETPPDVSLPV